MAGNGLFSGRALFWLFSLLFLFFLFLFLSKGVLLIKLMLSYMYKAL